LAELALGKEFFVAVFNFLKSAGVQRLNFALLEEGLAHEFDLRAESVDLVLQVLRVRVFERLFNEAGAGQLHFQLFLANFFWNQVGHTFKVVSQQSVARPVRDFHVERGQLARVVEDHVFHVL
jgi:uncharacterized protein (DUF2267 family)